MPAARDAASCDARQMFALRPASACLPSPAPELGRRLIQATGPGNEIFHAARREQRTSGLLAMHAKVLRQGDDAFLSQGCDLPRLCSQPYGADAGDRRQWIPALFGAFCFVE